MATWREIARELGERPCYSAMMCGATRNEFVTQGCAHDPATSDQTADECPFCADHAAYTRWYRQEVAALRRARAAKK